MREHEYRYVVVSRKRHRQFDPDTAVVIKEEDDLCIRAQRVVNTETGEVELYCHSSQRELKEKGIAERFAKRFEGMLKNGLIDCYRYLGYTPLPGAQLRYLIHCDHGVLGAIGFGAAAWKVAARDRWVGWEAPCREARLGRIPNNARFLLLPWVQVRNLASKAQASEEG